MRSRRTLLASASTMLLAGCTSKIESTTGDLTKNSTQTRKFGESASHNGVEATPTHWFTSDEITYELEYNQTTRTAETGATWLLTRIEAATVGDNQRKLPGRGLSGTNDVNVLYSGEETTAGMDNTALSIVLEDGSIPTYTGDLQTKDALSSVYPGVSVAGWIVSEIPEKYEPGKLKIKIKIGRESITEPGDTETREWKYTTSSKTTATNAVDTTSSNTTETTTLNMELPQE